MFLFFSKILPLFIYPIGLSCLLLILALVFLGQKRQRWAMGAIALALAVLLLSSNGAVSGALAKSLERQYVPEQPFPTVDAIVVLGGSTYSAIKPRSTVEVNEAGDRLFYAAQLYKMGRAPIVILSGGRIEWSQTNYPSEAEDMALLMNAMGVPPSAMILESRSLNTHENVVNVRAILQQQNFKRVLVVTSALHMPRAMAIFRKQNIEAIAAPTDFLTDEGEVPSLSLADGLLTNLPSVDHLYLTTRCLKEYIGSVIYAIKGWK